MMSCQVRESAGSGHRLEEIAGCEGLVGRRVQLERDSQEVERFRRFRLDIEVATLYSVSS